ncbi:MAG: protein TolB [Thermodesulfobacteriota bacterium]
MHSLRTLLSGTSLALLFSALLTLLPNQAAGRDYLDLSADVHRIPTAVPYFVNKKTGIAGDEGRWMADILGRALEFHGFITIISPDRYGGGQESDWKALGAELVVAGSYEVIGSQLALEMRITDILDGQMIFGRRYTGDWNKRKHILFKFCDEAVDKLTGEAGVASTLIAFVSDGSGQKEVYVTDILGDNVRQITKHRTLAVCPRFSPDGKRLMYTSYHRGSQMLYITTLGTETTRAISWYEGLNMAPAWAPDGNRLAVTLSKDGNPDLYLTGAIPERKEKLNIIERLTSQAGINVSPSWSPDGTKLAFVSDRTGTPQIYVMDLAAKATRRITFEGNYNTSPSWSPKGDLIAYSSLFSGNHQIFTISPEGGVPTQVTKTWGSNESPAWAPDGRQIVFSRKRDNQQQLCAIFKNGVGLRVVSSKLPGSQSMPQWSTRLDF